MDLALFKVRQAGKQIGKYKEKYAQYHKYFIELEKAIKSLKQEGWSILTVLELGYSLIQICWMVSKNLSKNLRAEFTVATLEYFIEDVLGWDLPDAVWDFILVAIEQYLSRIIPFYGHDLESNTPVTFQGKEVFAVKAKTKKEKGSK